jgi:hypothetical protein
MVHLQDHDPIQQPVEAMSMETDQLNVSGVKHNRATEGTEKRARTTRNPILLSEILLH